MKTSLTTAEFTTLCTEMITLIKAKSGFIDKKPEVFTNAKMTSCIREYLLKIADYIHRPDRYIKDNDTLKYILRDLCIDILKFDYQEDDSSGGGGATSGVIDEIKSGNTTVKYASESGSTKAKPTNRDDIFDIYRKPLQEYRRIY